jgi:hypothetical protein
MNRTFLAVAIALTCAAAAPAQTTSPCAVQGLGNPIPAAQLGLPPCRPAVAPQTFPTLPFQRSGPLVVPRNGPLYFFPNTPRPETGRPFSATVTTHTSQTFSDGTHVNQTATEVEYRDSQGRVRIESTEPNASGAAQSKVVTITDPVAYMTYRLDPDKKTVARLPQEYRYVTMNAGTLRIAGRIQPATALSHGILGPAQPSAAFSHTGTLTAPDAQNGQTPAPENTEDLGVQMVNGIPARGTRVTTVVPIGAIGNDREFRSVTERWFSSDLNLLIKSVSADPRFGATSYELTNIHVGPPDPSLFQVPSDYKTIPKVIEGIEFTGMHTITPDTLRGTIQSKVGEPYDEDAIRRDFTALWNTRRFDDIQVNTEAGPQGGVIVRFTLTERP